MIKKNPLERKAPFRRRRALLSTIIILSLLLATVLLLNAVALAQPASASPQSAVLPAMDPKPFYPYWEDDLDLQNVYNLTPPQPCCDFERLETDGLEIDGTYDFLATDGAQIYIDFAQQFDADSFPENTIIESVSYTRDDRSFDLEGTTGGTLDQGCYDRCVAHCNDYPQDCDYEDPNTYCASYKAGCITNEEEYDEQFEDENFIMTDGVWQLSERGRLLVRDSLAPSCQVPAAGAWQANSSCWFHESATLPGSAVVGADTTLVVGSGTHLNIDFFNNNLRIMPGGKVLIKPGGKIE